MSSLSLLSGTIMPWLVGAPLILSFVALLLSMKQWRDMKRSPYFFMRQQAGKRLQSYLSLSFVLLLAAAGVGFYGYREPADTTVRMVVLSNTKPADNEVREIVAAQASEAEKAAEEAASQSASGGAIADILLDGDSAASVRPQLPEAYDRFDPAADLKTSTELAELTLSTEVTEDYDPVQPGRVFAEGFYTLYATFDYRDMADGMEWAWVWRHNGAVVDGGNELWNYGEEGPGYIYLNPEEGFQEGNYTLEVWVNGELLGQAAATMNDAAVAAGN